MIKRSIAPENESTFSGVFCRHIPAQRTLKRLNKPQIRLRQISLRHRGDAHIPIRIILVVDGEEGGLLVIGHGHGVGGGHQGDAVALGGEELCGAVVAQGQGQICLLYTSRCV